MPRREHQSRDMLETARPIVKPLIKLHGEIKSPPMGSKARLAAGYYLRMVQDGEILAMPISRPMPQIAHGCHELRIEDSEFDCEWRIVYLIDVMAIVVLEVFQKKTAETPEKVKRACRERCARYLSAKEGK